MKRYYSVIINIVKGGTKIISFDIYFNANEKDDKKEEEKKPEWTAKQVKGYIPKWMLRCVEFWLFCISYYDIKKFSPRVSLTHRILSRNQY